MHETDCQREIVQIQSKIIGWISLGEGAYLHTADEEATEVLVAGLAHADMQASNVLWVY